jgi:hypothetical protein
VEDIIGEEGQCRIAFIPGMMREIKQLMTICDVLSSVADSDLQHFGIAGPDPNKREKQHPESTFFSFYLYNCNTVGTVCS